LGGEGSSPVSINFLAKSDSAGTCKALTTSFLARFLSTQARRKGGYSDLGTPARGPQKTQGKALMSATYSRRKKGEEEKSEEKRGNEARRDGTRRLTDRVNSFPRPNEPLSILQLDL